MKIARFILTGLGVLFFVFGSVPSYSAEVDVLINKLVQKGILTQEEATTLLKEMQKEGVRQKATVKEVATEAAKETAKKTAKEAVEKESKIWAKLPSWVNNIKFKGDFRLRYQYQDKEKDGGGSDSRNRGRYRFRLGVSYAFVEKFKVGFSVASGEGDPRSTNQTFTNSFEIPRLNLYTAYAEYKPVKWLKFLGGQISNPLYRPQDLVWDTDIKPQGVAAEVKYPWAKNQYFFMVPAFYVLNEFKAEEENATMFALQAGVGMDVTKTFWFKFAPGMYITSHVKGNEFKWSSGSNTRDADGKLIYQYNSFTLDGEFGFQKLGWGPIDLVSFVGQYVNSNADNNNQGWLAGFRFGRSMSRNKFRFGDWQFRYSYRKLEKDAVLDILPDSDFYGGQTNAQGHEIRFDLGLYKNVMFAIDYYRTEKIKVDPGKSKRPENLLQADINFFF